MDDLPVQDFLLAALAAQYAFPCYYPIVLIARNDDDFQPILHAKLLAVQDGADFLITRRESDSKNYISYKVLVFVQNAVTALARKEALSRLPGVLYTL